MPPLLNSSELLCIPCVFMRGGSSRGAFIRRSHLPEDTRRRDAVLLAAYGSPDTRQIDGIGGADPLTSKAALVELSDRVDADLEYTFCQVGIDRPQISTGGNCGNMLAGVGPFAIITGIIAAQEPVTTVRIYVTNISQVVVAKVPVRDGMPLVEGDCSVAGVPDPGARIVLDFGNCAGSVSGRLLPTGSASDSMVLNGRRIDVSLVDASTPFVFVSANDLEANGDELPESIMANAALLEALECVRGWAAVKLGLSNTEEQAREVSANIPRVMMVAPPQQFVSTSGAVISADQLDIIARQMAMQRPHRALAVTGAVCLSVATAIEGTIPAKFANASDGVLRIGHPGGVFNVQAVTTFGANSELVVTSVAIERTARLIMSGALHVRKAKVDELYDLIG